MMYKVFLVEDEIVTREGIRDKVDWTAAGFEFCGEAQDGEIALPLIEKMQPDVLITDIKMPFMDGLQLSRILKAQMPWVKVVILSGHDEFEFAQSALKLGVSEYLLKPISAVEIERVLQTMAATLDREREERANLKALQSQEKDILALKRERLLLRLVVGGISSAEAIEQYGQIGLSMIAQHYLVVLIRAIPFENNGRFDPAKHQQIQEIVTDLTNTHPGTFCAQKSVDEFLLIMTGDDPVQLQQDGLFLAELLKQDIEEKVGCEADFGVGGLQQRLTDIYLSFADALAIVNGGDQLADSGEINAPGDLVQTSKLDQSAVEHFLSTGLAGEFDTFFDEHLRLVCDAASRSTLIRHYLFVDMILTSAQFVSDLGGEETEVIPAMTDVAGVLADLRTFDDIKEALRGLISGVLSFRNQQARYEKVALMTQARSYIDANFSNPDLHLEDVAASVNLSSSHFSVVFGREIGEPFKSYLTSVRIDHAKGLLRTTNLKCSEIAYRSGYNDPHYFSYVFKKNTGIPPQQFRQSSQN